MDIENSLQPNSTSEYLAPMEGYKEAVLRRFPALPRQLIDDWFINPTNALVLGYFLEHYPRRVVALDIGTFVGASAFCFASHPKVSRVISVDPNPLLSEELTASSDRWAEKVDIEPLKDLKVFDVARAVLAEFDEEREKIELREGVVGTTQVDAKGGSIPGLRKVNVPVADPADGEGLVALVDGLHTREGVQADLAAVFEKNPRAVVLLDDCRNKWGPFVQAGVVAFVEGVAETYHFRVFGDLGLAKSSFGIVYPESVAAETDEVLNKIREEFRQCLEPAHLLRREEKLTRELGRAQKNAARFESRASNLQAQLSKARQRNIRISERVSRLEKRRDQLKEHRDQLNAHYSSRRYKLVDAIAGAMSRIPGLRNLLRRNTT